MKGSKKGKKSFADGLDASLDFTLNEDNAKDRPSMFAIDAETTDRFIEQLTQQEETPLPAIATALPKTAKEAKKNKSFSDRLSNFFDDSSAEEFGSSQLAAIKRSSTKNSAATSPTRPLVGIDQLLNRTLVEDEDRSTQARRITFVLPDDKLEKLKTLAREQGKPLNELVRELIEWHLSGQAKASAKKKAKV